MSITKEEFDRIASEVPQLKEQEETESNQLTIDRLQEDKEKLLLDIQKRIEKNNINKEIKYRDEIIELRNKQLEKLQNDFNHLKEQSFIKDELILALDKLVKGLQDKITLMEQWAKNHE